MNINRNWPEVLQALYAAGINRHQIYLCLRDKYGLTVNYPYLYRMEKHGTEPRWSIGAALLDMEARHGAKQPEQGQAGRAGAV